jgi:hypothetical protein
MRLTAAWDIPSVRARDRVDQWVASRGRLLEGLGDDDLHLRVGDAPGGAGPRRISQAL